MGTIADNLARIRATLPAGVELVAVSKFHPAEALREAYDAGQRLFGESRPQEMAAKRAELPEDIEWHMIGHLQTNKVKTIIPFVSLIHSVDSPRLAEAIDREAARAERASVDVLFEVHVAQEESKFGWSGDELERFLQERRLEALPHLRVRGLMGMASLTDDRAQIEREFETLRRTFDSFRERYLPQIDTLSMGISGDYPAAVAHGATMVRVGSLIFGQRNY